jgi:hypothetical protein
MRRSILALAKFLSRLFTAKNQAAINGHDGLREQVQLAAQHDELAAPLADGWPVVFAEVGNGLEVGHQANGQPHELDVALGLAFQAPAGLDAIEVPVDVDLELHRRVVRRPASRQWLVSFEPYLVQVELFDKGLDNANRVVGSNVVLQALRHQRDLRSILAFDESLHGPAPKCVASP